MWQRFTERARRVVFFAQEEAQRFGEPYVSTEHLLLGLIRESDNLACRVLDLMAIAPARVRAEVETQLPRADGRPSQDMTLTPRAKKVIDLAYNEARQLNNNYIGTEHLLLGLIREDDGLAARVLVKLGAELKQAQRIVAELQANEPRPPTPPPTPPVNTRYEPYNFLCGQHIVLHLVLAAIGDDTTISGRAVRELVEDVQSLQGGLWQLLMSHSRRGIYAADGSELAKILGAANAEAELMQFPQLQPFHILIAAAGQEGSTVAATLNAVGATAFRLRDVVMRLLEEDGSGV